MCSGVLVPWMTVDCIEKTDGVSPTVAEPSSFPVPCGRTVNHGHPYRDISESIAFHRFPSQSIDARRISSQPTIFHRASSVPIGIHRFPDRRCRIMPFFFGIAVPLWPDRPICGFRMPSTGIHRRWVVGRRFWYRVFRHTLHESLGILRKFFVNPRRSFAQGFKELSKNRQNPFSFYGRPRHLRRVGMADSGKRYEKTGPVVAGGRLDRFL